METRKISICSRVTGSSIELRHLLRCAYVTNKPTGNFSNTFFYRTMDAFDAWFQENNLNSFKQIFLDNGYDELEVVLALYYCFGSPLRNSSLL